MTVLSAKVLPRKQRRKLVTRFACTANCRGWPAEPESKEICCDENREDGYDDDSYLHVRSVNCTLHQNAHCACSRQSHGTYDDEAHVLFTHSASIFSFPRS